MAGGTIEKDEGTCTLNTYGDAYRFPAVGSRDSETRYPERHSNVLSREGPRDVARDTCS